jgi:hypothetical protein
MLGEARKAWKTKGNRILTAAKAEKKRIAILRKWDEGRQTPE